MRGISGSTILMVMMTGSLSVADIIYVDDDISGGDGRTWQTAFSDLQDAMAIAVAGDDILVAEGTYKPTDTTDREASFFLPDGVRLIGGYGQGSSAAPDWRAHPTILSGEIGDPDIVEDNTYRLIQILGAQNPRTSVDGFIFQSPFNERMEEEFGGNGVFFDDSIGEVIRCRFADFKGPFGNGCVALNTTITIRDCEFIRCKEGNGVALNSSRPAYIENCLFLENSGRGGGIFKQGGNLTVVNCTFLRNVGRWKGGHGNAGGIEFRSGGRLEVESCVFAFGVARAGLGAGAIHAQYAQMVVVNNCLFFENLGRTWSPCLSGGVFTNCIFWRNKAIGLKRTWQQQIFPGDGVTYNDCCVFDWQGAEGYGERIHGDKPRFVDADNGDFRLKRNSTLINRGDNSVLEYPLDLDRNPRVLFDVVDQGPYENYCDGIQKIRSTCEPDGELTVTVRTSLPEGINIRISVNGDVQTAATNERGKAVAMWNDQAGEIEVCVPGCRCRTVACP